MNNKKQKYIFSVNCENCGHTDTSSQEFGETRPIKVICVNCGTPAKTSAYINTYHR